MSIIGHHLAASGASQRRVPDPLEIFGGALSSWYRPEDAVVVGGVVTEWPDSVSARKFEPVSGSADTIIDTMNGRPCLLCTQAVTGPMMETDAPEAFDAPMYVAFVARSGNASGRYHFDLAAGWRLGGGNTVFIALLHGSGTNQSGAPATNTAPAIWETWRDAGGASATHWAGGSPNTFTRAPSATAGSDTIRLSGNTTGASGALLIGDLVIVRGSTVTPQQREQCRAWLSKRWGL